ncbi:MAG: hypothetical protein ACOC1K_00935 [Nanoarchaeota archaeon]
MPENVEVRVKTQVEGQENIGNLNEELKETTKSTESLGETIGLNNTKVGQFFSSFVSGAKKGVSALKSFKVALAATGIGVIIVAVTALVQYFNKTEEGAQKLRVIMSAVGAVVDALTDYLIGLGKNLSNIGNFFGNFRENLKKVGQAIKQNIINRLKAFSVIGKAIVKILRGDMKEGFRDLSDGVVQAGTGVTGFSDKVEKMGKKVKAEANRIKELALAAAELQKRQNNLNVANREAALVVEKLNGEYARQSLIVEDATKSTDERLAALDKQSQIQREILNNEIERQKEQVRIIQLQNELSTNAEEDYEREQEALVKLQQLENQRFEKEKEITTKRSGLLNEVRNRELSIQEEILQASQERRLLEIEDEREKVYTELEIEKENLQRKLEQRLENEEITQEQYLELKLEYDALYQEKKNEIDEEIRQEEIEKEQEQIEKENKLKEKALKKEEEKEKETQDEILEYRRQAADQAFNIANQLFNNIFSAQLDMLNRQKEEELSNENLTEKQKLKIQKEYAKKEADIKKKEAVIAGALAVIQAFAQLGPIAGAIAAVGIIATTAVQISQINRAAKFRYGGMVGGKKHSSGGTLIEAEQGEYVVSAASMRNPEIARDVIKANTAGQTGVQNYKNNDMDEDKVANIISKSLKSIPVVLTTSKLEDENRKVEVLESNITI